jgi:hypothetical protein
VKGTPASLPPPLTRRSEREPAKQPSQRLLNLAIDGGPRPLGLIPGRIHPVGRTPDANIDARLRSINAPAVLASPDDHGLRRRKQLIIAAPISGPETSQRRTRRSLKRLVRDPPLARAWLCARQLPDDSPEPLDANTTGRRGRRQLVVIAAADELKPALAAGPRAALILPHRPAADAARDRQATGRLHGITISPAPAAGSWPMPGPARACPARPCRRSGRLANLGGMRRPWPRPGKPPSGGRSHRVQACRFSANRCLSLMAGTTRGRSACNVGGQPTPGSHEGPGPRLSARASRGNAPG